MTRQNEPRDALGRTARLVELGLALFVLGSVLVTVLFGDSLVPRSNLLGAMVFFLVPLALAVGALVAVATDEIGVGSVLVGILALATVYVVAVSVYTLVTPSDGGVYVGHLISYLAAVILAVVVVFRPVLNRLFGGIWLRERAFGNS